MDEHLAGLDPLDLLDAEAARLDGYLGSLSGDAWARPSECAGWSVRDVLAHLAGNERYHRACLDGEVAAFRRELAEAGLDNRDAFNDREVRDRRGRPVAAVLAEWRDGNGHTRSLLRGRDPGGTVATLTGPYPVPLYAFHLASGLATHADDVHVPVAGADEPGRTHWRSRYGRFVLRERDAPVLVWESEPDGRIHVELDGHVEQLAPGEFVAATVGRLDPGHPMDPLLRAAVRCLA